MFYNVYGLIFNCHNIWGPLLAFVIVSRDATCSAMYESYGMKNSPIQNAIQYKKQTKQNKKIPKAKKKKKNQPQNPVTAYTFTDSITYQQVGVRGSEGST